MELEGTYGGGDVSNNLKKNPTQKTASRKKKLRHLALKKEHIALKIPQYLSKKTWSLISAQIEEAKIAKKKFLSLTQNCQ